MGLVAAFVAACGGATSGGGTIPIADSEDLRDAAEQARSLVKEAYQTLRRGNVGGLQTLVSEDLFAVGPGSEQVYSGRAEALDALTQLVTVGRKHRVASRGMVAVSSPSGKSAWVADQLKVDGVKLRLTAVLAEIDELWTIVALELSVPVTDKEANKLADDDQGTPARPVTGGVDDAAGEVAELFRQAAAAPEQFSEQLSDQGKVVAIGDGPRDFRRGTKSILRAWKKALKANPTMTLGGGLQASVTPDGALGWIAADVEASRDGANPVPHRYFVIYERSPEGWRMVAMHSAVVTPG
jgi:hypothetical protein